MDIQVAGYGIISAIGNDAQSVLRSLKEKQTGIGTMRYLDSSHKELPVGEVKLSNEEMTQMLGLDSETAIHSRTVLMGAIAIRQALEDAKLDLKGKRVVVINGTTVGGMDVTERYFLQMREQDDLLPFIEKHDCGSSTREMADLAGLSEAEVCTISTACSSAANAIILGSEMLKMGEADIVIAGGRESLSKFHLNGFNTLMILDKEQCRPFDKTRTGLNLGEGAAFVVLTRTLVKSEELRVKNESNKQGSEGNSDSSLFTLHSSLQASDSSLFTLHSSLSTLRSSLDEVIRYFGGFEMVAAIGAMLRAAEQHVLILVDGFIMTACAIAAIRLYPAAQDYMIFTHCGDESGHKMMLDIVGAKPLLNLGLRLGEGTGALCAFPIVDSAVRMMNEMNNFDNAKITKYF